MGDTEPQAASNGASSGSGAGSTSVTEAEAALYDRQIRLWGVEAQSRLRRAHIAIHTLTGLACEVVKNIVLAGVGAVTIVDSENVASHDLGAGFFFRQDDVGRPRVNEDILNRIRTLNPHVRVQGASKSPTDADVHVAFDGDLIELNEAARKAGKLFYAGRAVGFGGYIFVDLGPQHVSQVTRPPAKVTATFVPLASSLSYKWAKPPRRTPAFFYSALAIAANDGSTAAQHAERLGAPAPSDQTLQTVERAIKAPGELSPTCAVLGGILAQDILNAVGGKEKPIANWLVLDPSATGDATIVALGDGVRVDTQAVA